jgi:hypothetical protein
MVTPVYAVKGLVHSRRADTQLKGFLPTGFSAAFFIFPTIYSSLSHFKPHLIGHIRAFARIMLGTVKIIDFSQMTVMTDADIITMVTPGKKVRKRRKIWPAGGDNHGLTTDVGRSMFDVHLLKPTPQGLECRINRSI